MQNDNSLSLLHLWVAVIHHLLKSCQNWEGFGYSFKIERVSGLRALLWMTQPCCSCCCYCECGINMFSFTGLRHRLYGLRLILCDGTALWSVFVSKRFQLLTFTVHEGCAIQSSQGNVLLSKVIACTVIIIVAIFLYSYLARGKTRKSQRILHFGADIYFRGDLVFSDNCEPENTIHQDISNADRILNLIYDRSDQHQSTISFVICCWKSE